MKLLLTTAVLLVTAGCSAVEPADDDAAIRDLARRYAAAFADEDADAVVALLTDDFVALSPAKPPLVGKDEVRDVIVEDLAAMEIDHLRFTPEEIVVAGPWAWTWGVSDAEFRAGPDGATTRVHGKYLWILRRGDDGVWRIARDSAHAD